MAARPRRSGDPRPDRAAAAHERQRAAPDRRPDEQLRDLDAAFARIRAKHASDEYRAVEAEEIMPRKNFAATGSFIADDRPRALDLLGFASQLVFNTFHNGRLHHWEHRGDVELRVRRRARTQPRDDRVLRRRSPAAAHLLRAARRLRARRGDGRRGARDGRAALLVASGCPPGHSPSHIALDPVWARAQEAGVPIVFHVGGTGELIDPAYFRNGLPIPPDFHGGAENFRSVDYMGIPRPPEQTLATMIFDGVLDRFPELRIGVIEQGAIWVPSWTRQMESAFEAFVKHEERIRALVDATDRLRAAPDPVHAVSDRRRRLDHRAERARRVHVLVRLSARRRRAPAGRAVRGVARRRERRTCGSASTATTSSTSWGARDARSKGARRALERRQPRRDPHQRRQAPARVLPRGLRRAGHEGLRGRARAAGCRSSTSGRRTSSTCSRSRATPRRSGRRRCSGAGASTTSGCRPRRSRRSTRFASGSSRAGATDGFVTDFGPILSLFFVDPDGLEGEVCVPNPNAVPGASNPPGTPAAGYERVT